MVHVKLQGIMKKAGSVTVQVTGEQLANEHEEQNNRLRNSPHTNDLQFPQHTTPDEADRSG
jgi:hypothetical protein